MKLECSFAVRVGDKFVVKHKRGDRGPAKKDSLHVVLSRSCYIYIVNESISNQLNNKDFSSLKCVNISQTCSSS